MSLIIKPQPFERPELHPALATEPEIDAGARWYVAEEVVFGPLAPWSAIREQCSDILTLREQAITGFAESNGFRFF